MTDDIRRKRLDRIRQAEERVEELRQEREAREKLLERRRRERQRRTERITRISLVAALVAIGWLIFYFRSAIKNAAIAFVNLLHNPNFWTVFWIVLGILVFLGIIVFFVVSWAKLFGLAGETVKGAAKLATTELSKPRTKSEVYTHEATGTVVHYEMNGKSLAEFLAKQLVAESKMGKILDTDPGAEMKDFESTLMVKVLSQNKGSRRSKGGIYT